MADNKVRLVIRTEDGSHRPILWFKGYKEDELIWGPYGLNGNQAVLAGEWPDRHATYDSKRLQRYHLAACREKLTAFDHFSSHIDGAFHVKCTGLDKPLYSHRTPKIFGIDEHSHVFIEATILTDEVGLYGPAELRKTDAVIPAPQGSFLKIFFAIAGRKHSYTELMKFYRLPDQREGPRFELGSFQVQSIVTCQSNSDRPARGEGSVISLRFETAARLWLLKAFLFT